MRRTIFFIVFVLVFSNISAQELDAEQKKHIEQLVRALEKWPLRSAKKAANTLIEKGKVAVPFLIRTLQSGSIQTQNATAYCLGKLRAKEAFPYLVDIAKGYKVRSKLTNILRAMAMIHAKKAYPIILEFLKSPNQTGHTPAYKILAKLTKKEHLEALKELLKHKSYKARKYAIQLIGSIKSSEVNTVLLEALKDKSAYVAYQSAVLLGRKNSSKFRKKLLDMFDLGDMRYQNYIIMVLVFQEDNFRKRFFNAVWISQLLKKLRSMDLFTKGIAACALVNIGFHTNSKVMIQMMDKSLAPILIEILSGKKYFRDYMSLRKLAYQKLVQLTGQDFGYRISKWWSWWHTNSHKFRAVRLLKGVSSEKAKQVIIEVYKQGGINTFSLFLVGRPEKAVELKKKHKYKEVFVLTWNQVSDLLSLLKRIEFFSLNNEYGKKQPVSFCRFKLQLRYHRKTVIVYGNDGGPIQPIIDYVWEVKERNVWQNYWDSSKYPDWVEWYEKEAQWYENFTSKSLVNKHTKKLILKSYGWLDIKQREKAALHFLKLMKEDSTLSKTYIEWGLFHIRSELDINVRSEALIKALALTKDSFATTSLIEFIINKYSNKTKKLMLELTNNAELKLVLELLKHPNPHVRSAAAETLAIYPKKEVHVLYLMALMRDENYNVQKAAVYSLGKLKAKLAWEQIAKIVKNKRYDTEVRQAGIFALTEIDKIKGMSLLLSILRQSDNAIKNAIAQALGNIGNKSAIQALVAMINGSPSRVVKHIACNSLAAIKTDDSLFALYKLAKSGSSVDAQILCVRALKSIGNEKAVSFLKKLLEIKNKKIRLEAALALASYYDKKAVPILISALTSKKYGYIARKNLEKLSCKSYTEKDKYVVKKYYKDWWSINKNLSLKQWFFDALRVRGYNVIPLIDYLLDGQKSKKVVLVFMRALNDKDWFIRIAACHYLKIITKKDFGNMTYYTGMQTTKRIIRAWQNWYRNRKKN